MITSTKDFRDSAKSAMDFRAAEVLFACASLTSATMLGRSSPRAYSLCWWEITDLRDAEAAKLALAFEVGAAGAVPVVPVVELRGRTGPHPGNDILGAGGGSSSAAMLARGNVAVKLEPVAAEAAATSKSTSVWISSGSAAPPMGPNQPNKPATRTKIKKFSTRVFWSACLPIDACLHLRYTAAHPRFFLCISLNHSLTPLHEKVGRNPQGKQNEKDDNGHRCSTASFTFFFCLQCCDRPSQFQKRCA